jgi:hypothetical protein
VPSARAPVSIPTSSRAPEDPCRELGSRPSWGALRDHAGTDALLLAAGSEPRGNGRWLRWFATPGRLYRSHGRTGRLTGGSGRLTCVAHGVGSATMRYTGSDSGGSLACLLRQGRLMHLPTAWALLPAVVGETRCLTRGDDACVYTVHWHGRPRWTPAIVVAGLAIAGGGCIGAARRSTSRSPRKRRSAWPRAARPTSTPFGASSRSRAGRRLHPPARRARACPRLETGLRRSCRPHRGRLSSGPPWRWRA